jgi:hypothetical protein
MLNKHYKNYDLYFQSSIDESEDNFDKKIKETPEM